MNGGWTVFFFFNLRKDGSILGGAIMQGIYASADKGLVHVCMCVCKCVYVRAMSPIPHWAKFTQE